MRDIEYRATGGGSPRDGFVGLPILRAKRGMVEGEGRSRLAWTLSKGQSITAFMRARQHGSKHEVP